MDEIDSKFKQKTSLLYKRSYITTTDLLIKPIAIPYLEETKLLFKWMLKLDSTNIRPNHNFKKSFFKPTNLN